MATVGLYLQKLFYKPAKFFVEALDVVLGVSLASLCNYANNLANTPINPELQPYA